MSRAVPLSAFNLQLEAFNSPLPTVLCLPPTRLARLAVRRVLPTARAVLRELQAVRVVPLVLLGVVRPLLAVRAGQRYQHPVSLLRHCVFPRQQREPGIGPGLPARSSDPL